MLVNDLPIEVTPSHARHIPEKRSKTKPRQEKQKITQKGTDKSDKSDSEDNCVSHYWLRILERTEERPPNHYERPEEEEGVEKHLYTDAENQPQTPPVKHNQTEIRRSICERKSQQFFTYNSLGEPSVQSHTNVNLISAHMEPYSPVTVAPHHTPPLWCFSKCQGVCVFFVCVFFVK